MYVCIYIYTGFYPNFYKNSYLLHKHIRVDVKMYAGCKIPGVP